MYDSSNVNVLQMRLYTLSSHKTDEYVTSKHSALNNHFLSFLYPIQDEKFSILITSFQWYGLVFKH